MEEAQLETSKPSEILMGFPRYRRSHLKSETFHTLVRILSHCCNESHLPGANKVHSASQELKNHDNGTGSLEQASQEKKHEHLQFTGNDFVNLKDRVFDKEKQVIETFDGREFTGEFMMVVGEDESSSGREDRMDCESESVEALPNVLNKEQNEVEKLNQIVEGTEKLVDYGLTPLNLGLDENQNGSSDVDLMDYQVEFVEFRGFDIDTSGTESDLQLGDEFNQNMSDGFDASLIANVSTSAMEQASTPLINTSSVKHERRQKEMELVKPVCAVIDSLPTVEEGEFEDKEHGQKVHETMHLSIDDGIKTSESLDLSIYLKRQEKEMELINPVSAAIVSVPITEEGNFEREEQYGQKVPGAIQFSVDQVMKSEVSSSSTKHQKQQKEIDSLKSVCAAMVSLPTTEQSEFEKEEQHGQKVPEAVYERQQKEMGLVKPVCSAIVSLSSIEEGEFKKKEHDQKVHEPVYLSVDDGMKNNESLNLSIDLKRQQKEMELVNPVSAPFVSLCTEEGEFEKDEQHGQKAPEAIHFSVEQGMKIEASNSSIKHEEQQKEIDLVKPVSAAMVSLPATKESEFEKVEQHGQKVPEAIYVSVDQGNEALISSIEPKRQQKEMELVKPIGNVIASFPDTEEAELGKEGRYGQKVPEAMHLSVDQGMNDETLNLSKYSEEMSLVDIDILEAKNVLQHEQEQPEKIICANDATTSSNHPDEEGDTEEGEISGDFTMDEHSFDISYADSLMIIQRKDAVQKPKDVIENIVYPFNIQNGQKEENYELVQDSCNRGLVKPSISDKNGFPTGVDLGISREIINYEDLVEHGSVLVTRKSEDRDKLILEEDHQNTSAEKKAGINCKKKRGPVTEEKKAKKKEKKRKKRAEKNRKLGVKRLKLHSVQKPKTVTYCRHYLKGRCHEGDKCKFSHDIVPLTKSKPCCHFARHSCMKGDDCPFDHELSKYPCSNFVTRGSCSRGDACMFSHQMPTKQDVPTSSNDSKPELKNQLQSGTTRVNKPPNISSSSASQQKQISDLKGIQSHVNSENEVANTAKKPPAPAPKGISFINVSKSSPKQGMVTPNKESAVQIGTPTGHSASGTALKLENSKKTPVVAPKGINFLSFGNGHVSSFKSPICSFLSKETGIKLSYRENLGSPEQASPDKNDCSKVSSGTKQNVLKTALYSNEILKQNQSVADGMNLDFSQKAPVDHNSNNVQSSLTSHQDHYLRSVQEGEKASTSHPSTVTSSMLPTSFLPGQSSERLASGHLKHIFNSTQRALLSTLSFAAEHESNIKLKCPASASAMKLEMNKDVGNSSL